MSLLEVRYEKDYDIHRNGDRTISALLGGDLPGFCVKQVRVVSLERDALLGNHWREYGEVYGVVGTAQVVLEDIDSKERSAYSLSTGDRLFIPPRIALRIKADRGTVIVACSSEMDRDGKTHKYLVD